MLLYSSNSDFPQQEFHFVPCLYLKLPHQLYQLHNYTNPITSSEINRTSKGLKDSTSFILIAAGAVGTVMITATMIFIWFCGRYAREIHQR